jgi:hypothetical protein
MKPLRSNPPWTDKILRDYWAPLESAVGAKWMPRQLTAEDIGSALGKKIAAKEAALARVESPDQYYLDEIAKLKVQLWKSKSKKPKGYVEYGCGHYGCVMPTNTPGSVIKVTTDPTEAAFVAAYLSWEPHLRPNGIVRYHKILAIRGASRLKRPVFVLWRDEANHLGQGGIENWIRTEAKDFEREYYARSLKKTIAALGRCLDAARAVRFLTLKKPDAAERLQRAISMQQRAWDMGEQAAYSRDPVLKLAFQLQRFEENATTMENEPMGVEIGRALRECFTDHGLLLADVHTNNIGMIASQEVIDEVGNVPIITDPGHAIAMDDRYKTVGIEELDTAVAVNPRRRRR